MIAFRDRRAAETGVELGVHVNAEGVAQGIGPISHGATVHTDVMKTKALKQVLEQGGFDAAIGGARRDEEKSRSEEHTSELQSLMSTSYAVFCLKKLHNDTPKETAPYTKNVLDYQLTIIITISTH